MKVMFQVECEDWARWKKAYDAHAPKREGFQKDIFVGHEAENPNNVLMICEIPSMEELQESCRLDLQCLQQVHQSWATYLQLHPGLIQCQHSYLHG